MKSIWRLSKKIISAANQLEGLTRNGQPARWAGVWPLGSATRWVPCSRELLAPGSSLLPVSSCVKWGRCRSTGAAATNTAAGGLTDRHTFLPVLEAGSPRSGWGKAHLYEGWLPGRLCGGGSCRSPLVLPPRALMPSGAPPSPPHLNLITLPKASTANTVTEG